VSVKIRILFVDDDPGLLLAIEVSLRRDRPRWEMVFALGGQRGLEEARKAPFDVVVSDMGMPGIDGVALLGAIKSERPSTVILMLSGQADARVFCALPHLYRLLSKPCTGGTLRDAIECGIASVGLAEAPY
jgi:DNA-binding NtrC family response regulator